MGNVEDTSSQFEEISEKLDFIIGWIQAQDEKKRRPRTSEQDEMLAIDMLIDTTDLTKIASAVGVNRKTLYRSGRFARFRRYLEAIRKGEHL